MLLVEQDRPEITIWTRNDERLLAHRLADTVTVPLPDFLVALPV
ncbi:MAG: hypothetical protein ACFB9M_02490 [Myxococcota bacterium]